ncbi:glycerate kinase [Lachnospiraceae bacterium]|nr:glycerate kinase [Lachnospiraceae bacterium]
MSLRQDAKQIVAEAIREVLPDQAVKQALEEKDFGNGKIVVASVGKAAWQMAKAASELLGNRIERGVVLTKYHHAFSGLPRMVCYEAGHPVPDNNSFRGTEAVLELVQDLAPQDTVLFLLSGGGSALFEKPLIPGEELAEITQQLLACGADIVEINTIRKRLSVVKGGKFAQCCEPAQVYNIVLSDVLGDPLDMIASGPAYPDSSTCEMARAIVQKYRLRLSRRARECLNIETPKELGNVETRVTGSVKHLCQAAARACEKLGYKTVILTDQLACEAKEAGSFLASVAKSHVDSVQSLAFIAGGETVVHVTGKGKGGRNQELALAAALGIAGLKGAAVFSFGSDGTDGPTDAAGGFCDGDTRERLYQQGMDIDEVLKQNDSYHALQKCGGLIVTGATGTNVNDAAVVLIAGKQTVLFK